MKKQMKVPRGTERARRRIGLHQGWRSHGRGPRMESAKVPHVDLLAESTHQVNWAPETVAKWDAEKKAAKTAAKRIVKFSLAV